jgi:tetratricopeptide (TPR) repeat protein
MSDGRGWIHLKERASGKWQVPLFLCSTALLTYALFLRNDAAPRASTAEQLRPIEALYAEGAWDRAAAEADRLLLDADCKGAERAAVALLAARARFESAARKERPSPSAGRQVLHAFERAAHLGAAAEGLDWFRLGRAHEWQGQHLAAAEHYEKALQIGVASPFVIRQRWFELLRDQLDAPMEPLHALLDANLSEAGDGSLAPTSLLWTLEQKLTLLEADGRESEGPPLLGRFADHFMDSAHKNEFAYLEALALYWTGQRDEAESALRFLRNQINTWEELHAKSGWLLGRTKLESPTAVAAGEALSFFQDVVTHHPRHGYAWAARIGQGEALARLGLHDEALGFFRDASRDIALFESASPVHADEFRSLLHVLSESQRQVEAFPTAIAYAKLALELVPAGNLHEECALLKSVANLESVQAERIAVSEVSATDSIPRTELASSEEARTLFLEAAETNLRLARISPDDRQGSEALWRAAESLLRGGLLERAMETYLSFVRLYPSDSMVPRALWQVGHLCERLGRYASAIEAYDECHRSFPRSLEAVRSLVPTARCYMSMGPSFVEAAEKTLRIILDDPDVLTPRAPEFADALFLWGELLHGRGEVDRAVTVFEEALERYPDDPRGRTARFLLADSYRLSAVQLRRNADSAEALDGAEAVRREVAERLNRAKVMFRSVMNEYEETPPTALDRMERLQAHLARLYEADCYFESRDYRAALGRYDEACAFLGESPAALSLYVQIVNCHVFLGRPEEAKAALTRALSLVDTLPESAFDQTSSPRKRSDWKRYFEWLRDSRLF